MKEEVSKIILPTSHILILLMSMLKRIGLFSHLLLRLHLLMMFHLFKVPFASIVFASNLAYPLLTMELLHDSWHDAMHDEINALNENYTEALTDLPACKRVVGCKWP